MRRKLTPILPKSEHTGYQPLLPRPKPHMHRECLKISLEPLQPYANTNGRTQPVLPSLKPCPQIHFNALNSQLSTVAVWQKAPSSMDFSVLLIVQLDNSSWWGVLCIAWSHHEPPHGCHCTPLLLWQATLTQMLPRVPYGCNISTHLHSAENHLLARWENVSQTKDRKKRRVWGEYDIRGRGTARSFLDT